MTDNQLNAPHDWLSELAPALKAQEFWRNRRYQQTVSGSLFLRLPGRPFLIAAGMRLLAEHLRRFRFDADVIERMARVSDERGRAVFDESFLNQLQRARLRTQIYAAQEGRLLLPDEPILHIRSNLMQAQLLEGPIRRLILYSTQIATDAAWERFQTGVLEEEDAPSPPKYSQNPYGWQKRAAYIGAAPPEVYEAEKTIADYWQRYEIEPVTNPSGEALFQIRRLFDGDRPLGDQWLSGRQESESGVSQTHAALVCNADGALRQIHMNRFQNLYRPLLYRGQALSPTSGVEYKRQRTLRQLKMFSQVDIERYPRGWKPSL